jgi:hypothetical protein
MPKNKRHSEQGDGFGQVSAALEGERPGQVPCGVVFGIGGTDLGVPLGSLIVCAGLVVAEGFGERLLDVFGFHNWG